MPAPSPHPRPAILVVDDDAAVREAVAYGLGDRYTVYTAASSAAALAILRAHPIAAILLDAILKGEHGLDLVARFRTISPARIVLLTGYGSKELVVRALWAHVDGYVEKPASLSTLHAAIERAAPAICIPGVAARARQALDAYPPKPFRAADLAHQLGVGEAHLRRLFRAAYGKTPRRYLAEVRLARARDLLRTTDQGVKEVAQAVGFPNLVALRRGFRRLLGSTPHASRRGDVEPMAADQRQAVRCPKVIPFCPKVMPRRACCVPPMRYNAP